MISKCTFFLHFKFFKSLNWVVFMIYHLFNANHIHHVRTMSDSIMKYSKNNNENQIHAFALFGLSDDSTKQYQILKSKIPGFDYEDVGKTRLSVFKFFVAKLRRDSIVIHGGFIPYIWFILFMLGSRKLQYVAWVCWGAGAIPGRGIKGRLVKFVKCLVLPRLGAIVALTIDESQSLSKYFGCSKNVSVTQYMNEKYLEYVGKDASPKTLGAVTSFLLGNSSDPANCHLSALHMLGKFKNENIKIFCPLGYGTGDSEYIEKVILLGKELFGKKFIPICELLEPDDYRDLLLEIDILIINATRQMALYNVYVFLLQGKKVFIPSESSLAYWLSSNGILFDSIDSFSSKNFMHIAEILDKKSQKNNVDNVLELLFSEKVSKQWAYVYQKIENCQA